MPCGGELNCGKRNCPTPRSAWVTCQKNMKLSVLLDVSWLVCARHVESLKVAYQTS